LTIYAVSKEKNMLEYKDFLSPTATIITGVFAVFIAIRGWNRNAEANRTHHIFQERLKRRLIMFDLLLPVVRVINKQGVFNQSDLDNVEKADVAVQLYGYRSEIDTWREFVALLQDAARSGRGVSKDKLKDVPLLFLKLRDELGYPADSVTENSLN
jgi:hypothetical protein